MARSSKLTGMRPFRKTHKTLKEYIRRCKRCNILYKTKARNSKICEDCKLPNGNKKEAILNANA